MEVPSHISQVVDGDGIVGKWRDMGEGIDVSLLAWRGIFLGLQACYDALQEIEPTFGIVLVVPLGLVGGEPREVVIAIGIAIGISEFDVEISVCVVAIAYEAMS